MMDRIRHLDIQTKIILVLVAVIVPTFLIVTVIENKLTQPILEAEMQQIGTTAAESLATKILSNKWLSRPGYAPRIENEIQEQLYYQTSIARMDVYAKDAGGILRLVATNMLDEDGLSSQSLPELVDKKFTEFRTDEGGVSYWDIKVPIRQGNVGARKTLGMVHVLVSNKTVTRLLETFWKITGAAAAVSVVILILFLTFFLRKTVANERLLRLAEDQNLQLTQQLNETQRQLMNVEKLAVMGQLTANFAHEIGTPLNAIGGHLQLLQEELRGAGARFPGANRSTERLEIISGEVLRIEKIVKGFLQTTAKPVSQKQLVDVNRLIEKTLGIVRPRLDALQIEASADLDRSVPPLRVVPLDIEQILLNLVNNSLDSLQTRAEKAGRGRLQLKVKTEVQHREEGQWAEVSVYDTGLGISKLDLKNVIKPFFTTKAPGEGTGLGLTICEQLAMKYGGMLKIDSKEGVWARVTLSLPYQSGE